MPLHLQKELVRLRKRILALGARVEEAVRLAEHAIRDRDAQLAEKVIAGDGEVDRMEVDLEEECLKVLALHQPVASDLRFIVALLKINNDFERMADLAVNMAKRARFFAHTEPIGVPDDFFAMGDRARAMVRSILEAFIDYDADAARRVCEADDEVDALNKRVHAEVCEAMRKQPDRIEAYTRVISAARCQERIADLATNIAEDLIYMLEGSIVRHQEGAEWAQVEEDDHEEDGAE